MAFIRTIPFRRAVPAALAVGMLLTILPAATFAETPPDAVLSAEWKVLGEVNRVRENQGLAPLRMADDVREIARERSRSMKRLDYFAHVSPNGTDAGDLLNGRGIAYRYWGEAIGWTVNMDLDPGSRWMVDWWKNSPVHRELMLSRSFNYAGVGIAQDGPKVLWTIVFVNQADRTAPVARVGRRHKSASFAPVAAGRTVVRWWGYDRPLALRTAGLQSFSVQHRAPGGDWNTVIERTTARQASWALRPGTHWFRVRARDHAGNVGAWQDATRIEVPGPRSS
jgi:uncharacterized protein YkwD